MAVCIDSCGGLECDREGFDEQILDTGDLTLGLAARAGVRIVVWLPAYRTRDEVLWRCFGVGIDDIIWMLETTKHRWSIC